MSWISSLLGGAKNVAGNIGSTVKKAVVDTGHEVGRAQNKDWVKALEAAGLAATGVGAPAAAGILGAGSMLGGAIAPGGNLGTAAGQGVKGAALGGAAGLAGGAVRGAMAAPSIGGVLQAGGAVKGALGAVGGGSIPGLQGVGDFLGGAKNFLTGNGGGNALAAAQGVNAALLGKKSSDYAENAMGSVDQNWKERDPLRVAGQAGMLNPQAGVAAKIGAIPNHNLYSKPSIGRAV